MNNAMSCLITPWATLNRTARSLWKSPGFTLPALLVLALAVGATTSLLGTLRTLLFPALPFRDSQTIVRIAWHPRGKSQDLQLPGSLPLLRDLQQNLKGVSYVAGIDINKAKLTRDGDPVSLRVASVTDDFFKVFEVSPLVGTTSWPQGSTRGVVLGEATWTNLFNRDPTVLGRTVILDGISHPILGVLPSQARLMGCQAFIPLESKASAMRSRGYRFLSIFARMSPATSLQLLRRNADTLCRNFEVSFPETDRGFELTCNGFEDLLWKAHKGLTGILALLSGIMLMIALVNLGSQFLVRALSRSSEVGVRTVLGATPFQAVRSGMLEAFGISFVGGSIGAVLAQVCLSLLRPLVAKDLQASRPLQVDLPMMIFSIGASIFVCTLLSVAPGFLLARMRLAQLLRDSGRGRVGSSFRWVRKGFVAVQVAMAITLLACVGVLFRSMLNLSRVELGIVPADLTVCSLTTDGVELGHLDQEIAQAIERLQQLPSIVSAACTSHLPVQESGYNQSPALRDQKVPESFRMEMRWVSPGFFKTFGVRFISGVDFTNASLPQGSREAIISESAAKACWPGQEPLGKEIGLSEQWYRVVGVVADVRAEGPASNQGLETTYLPCMHGRGSGLTIGIRFHPGQAVPLSVVRQLVREAAPDLPIGTLSTMESVVRSKLDTPRTLVQLLGIAGGLALMLSLIGVYGTMSFEVGLRRSEFGIRIALGAIPRDLLTQVLMEGARVGVIGAIIGILLTWVCSRLVQAQAFGVPPFDLISLGFAVTLLVLGSTLAGLVPASAASRVEPMAAIRQE